MQRASHQPVEDTPSSTLRSSTTVKRAGSEPLRVVICGGGSGGLVLATALAGQNGRQPKYAVTLADPVATHVWKPLLHEFASGSADASFHEVAYIALARWHGFHFAQGPLEAIDRDKREVLIGAAHDETGAELAPPRRLPYDILVIAVGGVTNDFRIPGVRENAYFLDSARDAENLHRRIVQACMRANHGLDAGVDHLDIGIIGGGATGVELAAELRATTRELLAYGLDNLDPEKFIRLRVVNADPRLLLALPARIAFSVEAILHKLDIEVLNSRMVTEVLPGQIMTKSGETIPSDITIWAAGVKAPSFLAGISGLETNRADQLVVTPSLQTTRDPNIFAIGDCAAAPWLGENKQVPPRAQAAYQQARYLLRAIPRAVQGEALAPFKYNDLGSLVSLGGQSAVGTLMGLARGAGIRIEGFLAQMIYRWLYKRHQAALYGWWAVSLDSIGGYMRRVTRPQVKVH